MAKAQRVLPDPSQPWEPEGHEIFSIAQWNELAEILALSPRELQIVRGVFDDGKEITIAQHLGISPHTVHTYLERIYRKLAVNSRVQLVVRVVAVALQLDRRQL